MKKKKTHVRRSYTWVGIDPGIDGTGVTVWHGRTPREAVTLRSTDKASHWLEQAWELAELVDAVLERARPSLVVIEKPFVLMASERTIAAALSDSVVKLTLFTGMLLTLAKLRNAEIKLVLARQWKGQLPRNVLDGRIKKWLEKEKIVLGKLSVHARDALGMCLSHLGEL